jgi:quercetin dioxygenase-like cupin family protein
MIFCVRGWVRVAYEDQGEPIVMEAGDCVLQPPHIRHRVLESSPDLHIVEIGCPAVHDTLADRTTTLPTGQLRPDRDFGGQRFVYHDASEATWLPWRFAGFEHRDTGIATATDGLAGVRVARPTAAGGLDPMLVAHGGEFAFWFVLDGEVTLRRDGGADLRLAMGDSVVIPAGMRHALADPTGALELLDVSLPAELPLV